jgi:hypothetical protein
MVRKYDSKYASREFTETAKFFQLKSHYNIEIFMTTLPLPQSSKHFCNTYRDSGKFSNMMDISAITHFNSSVSLVSRPKFLVGVWIIKYL